MVENNCLTLVYKMVTAEFVVSPAQQQSHSPQLHIPNHEAESRRRRSGDPWRGRGGGVCDGVTCGCDCKGEYAG